MDFYFHSTGDGAEGKDWLWIDWNKPIQLWNDETFCIDEYLKKKGRVTRKLN